MAEALGYMLEARGVSEAEAEAAAEFLIAAEAASPPARSFGYALSGRYDYDRVNATAFFWKSEEATWPDADRELAELSGLYPEALFVLDTTGFEEEMRRRYFKGGRFYAVSPEVVYPEFDEAMLGCA